MRTHTLSASLEDYLEAIYLLIAQRNAARVKDISGRLKVNYSSVTNALKELSKRRLVNYKPYELVTLTSEGKALARDIIRRHEVLRDFFVKVLAIDPAKADEAACEMEHAIPPDIFERLIQFIDYVETCPGRETKWTEGIGFCCEHGDSLEECETCVARRLEDIRRKKRLQSHPEEITMRLSELTPGLKSRVLKLGRLGIARQRIMEMGVTPGALIEVERVAPLGDPIQVKVRGYHLSLRKEEASKIRVERP